MKEPTKRVITGAVFGLIMLSAIFAGKIVSGSLFLIIALLAVAELLKLLKIFFLSVSGITILFLSLCEYLLIVLSINNIVPDHYLILLISFPWIVSFSTLLSKKNNRIQKIIAGVVSLTLIVTPFAFISLFYVKAEELGLSSWAITAMFFALLWINDSFAYFIGKPLGRTPLIPSVSPGKTVEGTVGGFICTILAGWGITFLFPQAGTSFWMAIAIAVAVGGIVGDLSESVLKRYLGIKDSGKILPGHGGILDRFDSMLMAASFVFILLILL